ncbi:MAG TPA: glycosyltransferase [Candidatus Dependentiae bacterium]|nr:glycosyltransferase [Candidatus Dependentiae bacterium]
MKHTLTYTSTRLLSLLLASCIIQLTIACITIVPIIRINNEQTAIVNTLNPFIEAHIQTFILSGDPADTTFAYAQDFLNKHQACAHVNSNTFEDDSTYVNYMQTYIKTVIPDADFCLLVNGQWILHDVNSLVNFCSRVKDEQCPVYWIKLYTHGIDQDFYKPCLIRCSTSTLFSGYVDARPDNTDLIQKAPTDIFFEWNRIQWGIANTKRSLEQTLEQLIQAYQAHPDDTNITFNLAQTYESLNDLHTAYTYYMASSLQTPATEIQFIATYKLGQLLDKIASKHSIDCWDLQYRYYMKAYEMRPWRAEPLVCIAEHFLKEGNHHLAFMHAQQAAQINYPEHDTIAIDRQAYEYNPYDILGITGWYIGEFEIGEQALRKGLQKQPYNNHLKTNLGYYIKRKESIAQSSHKDPRIPAGFGVDFHDSMKHGFAYNYETIEQDPFLQRIKTIYEKYTINDIQYAETPRIPKIIHHIWLGSALPEKYKAWQKTWLNHHPDWEYRLWTQKEIDEFGLKNRTQFDEARTYGEKSDIARYEILYRLGGVYTDTDFECLQPMDVFHHCCDFYAGLEGTTAVIGNSMIGSAPGHPILKRCIDTLRSAQEGEDGWQYVVERTGPGHLTKCVKEEIMTPELPESRIIIFPACYFFPWYPVRPEPRPVENVIKSLRPETFALHLWESSWVK